MIKRAAFVGTIGAADDDIVDVYSVGLASIAEEVIIPDCPEVVHRRAVMKKSVAAIVLADGRPPHDMSIGVDEIPGAGASGDHAEVPHAAGGIPNKGVIVTIKATAGVGSASHLARIIDAKGLGISASERAEVPHTVRRIPDESVRHIRV